MKAKRPSKPPSSTSHPGAKHFASHCRIKKSWERSASGSSIFASPSAISLSRNSRPSAMFGCCISGPCRTVSLRHSAIVARADSHFGKSWQERSIKARVAGKSQEGNSDFLYHLLFSAIFLCCLDKHSSLFFSSMSSFDCLDIFPFPLR